MKKFLLAAALAVTALGASAHQSNRIHYHNDDGTVTFSRGFESKTETTYERDRYGRTIRVETTTSCGQTRVNPRNNHLRCLDEDVTVRRYIESGPVAGGPNRPSIDPVVYRSVERDQYGRRVIVTTTYTCSDARWNPSRTEALCFDWDQQVEREVVRRQPRSNSLDLNGDGRTDGWERLLFQSFREVLEDNQ
jgi:hypothetical protein